MFKIEFIDDNPAMTVDADKWCYDGHFIGFMKGDERVAAVAAAPILAITTAPPVIGSATVKLKFDASDLESAIDAAVKRERVVNAALRMTGHQGDSLTKQIADSLNKIIRNAQEGDR